MTNPWLDIPLADYEGHMSLPAIGQAEMLNDQLGALIARFCPSSVAVIGCAGGNGFAHGASVARFVGVDINPRYIEVAASRYRGRMPGLELHVADIQCESQLFRPVELIFGALVFEYVDLAASMRNLARHCVRGGRLAALVQLPHAAQGAVTPSPYSSLQRLGPVMKLVAPEMLVAHAAEAGFVLEHSHEIDLPSGKLFALQVFRLTDGDAGHGRQEIEESSQKEGTGEASTRSRRAEEEDARRVSDELVHGSSGGEIAKRPWGERSFYAEDTWGNPLCFVEAGTTYG